MQMPRGRKPGKSTSKYTTLLNGKKTSVSLEIEFWNALKEIAASRQTSHHTVISEIASQPQQLNLSSAIRLYVLNFYKNPSKFDLQ